MRQGFRLISLDGMEGTLADVVFRVSQLVGRYGVDVAVFKALLVSLDLPEEIILWLE